MTVNRETTVPFHLKLFYRQNAYHTLNDFPIPTPTGPNSTSRLPPHLEIYTWQSCTLRELSSLLAGALPSQLPTPQSGTRLCFRLIYPDTRGAATEGRGRYLSKDIGSVILGQSRDESSHNDGHANGEKRRLGDKGLFRQDDADKTLADARFVIGDYVDVAIVPPLDDGSVAPPVQGGRGPPVGPIGGGMRAFGPPREGGGGRRGGGPSRGNGIPTGDWKRGERVPEERGGWGRRR
ncbi:Sin3 associated polypeptide p18-domain-containing protein, partial [Talaromyces proteolyticus]